MTNDRRWLREATGQGSGAQPVEPGFHVDSIEWLSAADRKKIFEDNARKVYPRLARG
jgi:hypothetical protein